MINPKAYLTRVKNVRRGLEARSKLVEALSAKGLTIQDLCEAVNMRPGKARYHLQNMMKDGVVKKRRNGRRVIWELTGTGQASIEEVV
jgi:predicted transcriptional regulator